MAHWKKRQSGGKLKSDFISYFVVLNGITKNSNIKEVAIMWELTMLTRMIKRLKTWTNPFNNKKEITQVIEF